MDINYKVCVVGLGYVGLPLSICFSKKFDVIGLDIDSKRVKELINGVDSTNECKNIPKKIIFTDNVKKCTSANVYIITVPTPVDENNKPDLGPLIKASEAISNVIKKGDFIIYESTVFPGVTEEICVPILEKYTKLELNKDFFVGYSPERVVPGSGVDIKDIKKIVSGSNKEAARLIESLYSSVIEAGVFLASSIKVAEAAKVIENTQRDVNIALVNELSMIFNELDINTNDVLDAASTKWNFTRFSPGLVGGHCIGVDPYYLSFKAKEAGINPKLILSSREINESVPNFIAKKLLQDLINKDVNIKESNILILGYTFKENCADDRNTKVESLVSIISQYGCNIDIFDPYLKKEKFLKENPILNPKKFHKYDALIIAVSHDEFAEYSKSILKPILTKNGLIFDLKSILPKGHADFQL